MLLDIGGGYEVGMFGGIGKSVRSDLPLRWEEEGRSGDSSACLLELGVFLGSYLAGLPWLDLVGVAFGLDLELEGLEG